MIRVVQAENEILKEAKMFKNVIFRLKMFFNDFSGFVAFFKISFSSLHNPTYDPCQIPFQNSDLIKSLFHKIIIR